MKKVTDQAGNTFILQLEFQTQDDIEMVYRMAEYKALIQRKYQLPVKQFVIYLGSGQPKMRTELTPNEQIIGFLLKNIQDFQPNELTSSTVPQEILLAVLSNYKQTDAEKVISTIITKLQLLSNSQVELEGYLKQLLTLSRLRKLEEITKSKVKAMPIIYDITTDGLYLEGKEETILKTISNLIRQGVLTDQQIAEVMNVDLSIVLEIKAEVKK